MVDNIFIDQDRGNTFIDQDSKLLDPSALIIVVMSHQSTGWWTIDHSNHVIMCYDQSIPDEEGRTFMNRKWGVKLISLAAVMTLLVS